MAYFNVEYITKHNLDFTHFMYMQLIFQNKFEDHSELLERLDENNTLQFLLDRGFVQLNKRTLKSQTNYHLARLSKVGAELYRDSQIMDITADDLALYTYLEKLWEDYEKPVGNPIAGKKNLAQFFAETGYNRRVVYQAVKDMYLPSMMEVDKGKFIPSLENFIWRGNNAFAKAFKLEESKLYAYLQENLK